MKIKLNKDLKTSCPGDHVVRSYKKGQVLYMDFNVSHIPGRLYAKGTFGWLGARKSQKTDDPIHEEWVFWSNCDIDFALIINPQDVETLWLTQVEYNQLPKQAVDKATFEIIVDE